MLIFFTKLLASDYKETLSKDLSYLGNEPGLLSLNQVELQHNELLFYKDKSYLLFNKQIPFENWSAELEMTIPKFEYPHQSGLYFWYTRDVIKEGATENFHGFVSGIEFVGSAVETMVAIHEVSDSPKVVKDFVSPNLLKEHTKITFKVIHTENNLKVEIYANGFLIYDHLRLLDREYFGNHEENGHVSLSYTTNTSDKEHGIRISQIKIYEREEYAEYDPLKEISLPKEKNSEKDNLEISHAVAKLDHFFKYIKIILGKPTLGTISKMAVSSNKEIKKLSHEVNKIKHLINNQPELTTKEVFLSAGNLERRIRDLQKEMMDLQRGVRSMIDEESKLAVNLYYVLLASVFGVVGMALRTFIGVKKVANSKLVD